MVGIFNKHAFLFILVPRLSSAADNLIRMTLDRVGIHNLGTQSHEYIS